MVLADPAASFWLKGAIGALDKRDPCDALSDAEALLELAKERLNSEWPDRPDSVKQREFRAQRRASR